jgi:hypothetical protein
MGFLVVGRGFGPNIKKPIIGSRRAGADNAGLRSLRIHALPACDASDSFFQEFSHAQQ